jgi:hypothetical protein
MRKRRWLQRIMSSRKSPSSSQLGGFSVLGENTTCSNSRGVTHTDTIPPNRDRFSEPPPVTYFPDRSDVAQ